MIWFALLTTLFFIVYSVLLFSWRRSIVWAGISGVIAVILAVVSLVNLGYTCGLPDGFKSQQVYEVTEEGVVRESDITYYQDENGDWYVRVCEDGCEYKMWTNFFYKFEFEKVDPPVFKNGNFIIGDVKADVTLPDSVKDSFVDETTEKM